MGGGVFPFYSCILIVYPLLKNFMISNLLVRLDNFLPRSRSSSSIHPSERVFFYFVWISGICAILWTFGGRRMIGSW